MKTIFPIDQESFWSWFQEKRRTLRPIGMIASANLFGLGIGIAGSLIQAHFISPYDLGFIRKYSIIANYAAFLSLGFHIMLQREYPVLIGQGKQEQAKHAIALVQSYVLLVAGFVCSGLLLISIGELITGNWREASAWFIQVVSVWAILFGGYLSSIFRSGQEFEKLAKGQFFAAITNATVLPLFWIFPFLALVIRSIVGSIFTSAYLYIIRPVKVDWYWSGHELWNLAKRSLQLYLGDYLRYMFWLSVEIWLMLKLAGDLGVGLLVFSRMITDAISQVLYAINQVYLPRMAQHFGQTSSIRACLKLSYRPTLLNLGISFVVILSVWFAFPPILGFAFPKYIQAIPLMRILALQTVVVSISLPLYIVVILEGYHTQIIAAVFGLAGFTSLVHLLARIGMGVNAVAWGTLAGQVIFASICLGWVFLQAQREACRNN